MEKQAYSNFRNLIFNFYIAGLLAIGIIIFPLFLPGGRPDVAEFISISAIAMALPMLAGISYIVNFVPSVLDYHSSAFLLFLLAAALDLVGIGAALWHITWIASVLFIASTIATATYTIVIQLRHLRSLRGH